MTKWTMKYELLPDPIPFSFNGKTYTLFKIKALEDFGDIKTGDVGGMVESTANLCGVGSCWLTYEAQLMKAKAYFTRLTAQKYLCI